ncbi:uncharacterized protein LOC117640631 isoform X2 [Thrips palmi]|uniref:Uncharacterized protein LOC117640631 isoform X2 n=1 Tax=Thrips palmi TaxID=161013 RepID=A0A6P8YGW5_THRPL|nr:uncharacterized protein LOC117640631 isoform X2 [Thrips palmi]
MFHGPPGMSRGRGGYSGPPRGAPRGAPRGRGSSEGGWVSRGMSRGRGYQGGYQGRGGPSGPGGGMPSSSVGQWRGHQDSSSHQGGYRNDRYPSAGSRPSDSRYPSTRGGGTVDYNNRRYTPRDGPPSYSSSREHHRSPEPVPRKRIRTEGYPPPAASRRSHEGGYEYSSSRYEYGSEKSGYSNEDRGRPVYREDRRPSADRRDDYHSPRSRDPSGSSMPPPAAPTRGVGSYRGVRGRGIVARSYPARRPTEVSSSLAARKRTLIESYAAKRRILTGRSQDYYKKLKSIKLRSAALMSVRRDGIKSEQGDSEDDLENWDDEPDKDAVSDSEEKHKTGDECDEDVESEEPTRKKVVRKIVNKVVVKKKVVSAEDGGEGTATVKTEEEGAGEDDNVDEAVEEEMEADVDGDKEPKMQVTIKHDSESRAVSDDGVRKTSSGKPGYKFIKLLCPHCKERCVTFKEYQNHLRGLHHVNAMRKLSFRLKQNLARMRVEQRIQQRLDEKNDELRGVAAGRTNYCHTCKLNYRQERTRHNESEMHKKMKEFLMPTCVICRINFRSPMLFENHICSLEHIKIEERVMRGRDRDHPTEKEVDMDSLLVLDSVGSADESDSDDEAMDDKSEGKDGEKREKKKKAQINLGADYVKKVEVMYCELCAIYLPRTGEEDVALANHCRTRNHLQRYVRYKDDRALRKEAERIHRRDKAEQEARNKAQEITKDTKAENSSSETEKTPMKDNAPEDKQDKGPGSSTGNEGANDSADLDDKIWADVDKGLDELLREVEPGNKSSDDDDESGRYDRFRYSDKKGGKASSEDREVADTSSNSLPSTTEVVPKQENTSPKEN